MYERKQLKDRVTCASKSRHATRKFRGQVPNPQKGHTKIFKENIASGGHFLIYWGGDIIGGGNFL